MKKIFVFTFMAALALCAAQFSETQAAKDPKDTKEAKEANKLARDGAEASKSQDFDKAVELLRKATDLDHKYADELAAVYQQRAYAAATNQQFQDAVNDYCEAIKLKPNEVRYYAYRSYIYELKGDIGNSMGDTDKVLKLDPKNKEAISRKKRLETLQSMRATPPPPPPASRKTSPAAVQTPHKP